ncbi:MAG: motility associated factor glycosyltransferase family protein [Phycisphaerales bacterium]|nr:motility associated factor glycosyltransferase family protein [Phycisphaerales bacterium]
MTALFRADGRLAQRIDECEPDGSVVVEPGKRGGLTVSVSVPGSDRRVYLHSRVDPEAEAERFADTLQTDNKFCFVVNGFGLGLHVRKLFERLKGDAFIIVCEPNLHLLRAAMETIDLAGMFADSKCILLTRADKGEVQTRLEPHNTLMMLGAQFVAHPASERVAADFHAAMRKLIADHLTYCRMCIMTLVANSRITARNVACNLPTYLSTPPIDVLRDRFKGYPAIVVAAGPSLRRNIDLLAELQGKAVICTVQTTFKMLLERGIKPDFVTSLDYHEISKRFFENLPDQTTHLVAEPKVNWNVIDTYQGPISLLDNHFARLCVGPALAARGGLKAGATVAHLTFYLAAYLGCDPIVLVGQDLAYTNHVYYSPGSGLHNTWRPELNRFCTIEMKEWERIVRNRRILMKVKDADGHNLYTDELMFTYLQQFEGDFSAVPGRVIDATEGGVRKAGTRVMTLAEVEEQYCRQPIPSERFAYRRELDWHDPTRLETGRAEIETRLDELADFTHNCQQMIVLLREMTELLDRPAVFNLKIAEVDALRTKIRRQDVIYQMVSAMIQHAELVRFSADRRLNLADVEGVTRARRQLDRDIQFVEAVIEGTEALKDILAECERRLLAAIEKAKT